VDPHHHHDGAFWRVRMYIIIMQFADALYNLNVSIKHLSTNLCKVQCVAMFLLVLYSKCN